MRTPCYTSIIIKTQWDQSQLAVARGITMLSIEIPGISSAFQALHAFTATLTYGYNPLSYVV